MSEIDSPAGRAGGPVPVPAVDELPEKMRVHALARLLGRTSREVITALAGVGVEVRSAQSSIDRKSAEQVFTALHGKATGAAPSTAPATGSAEPDTTPDSAAAEPEEPAAALVPLFAPPAPLFQPPAAPARRRRGAVPEAV